MTHPVTPHGIAIVCDADHHVTPYMRAHIFITPHGLEYRTDRR